MKVKMITTVAGPEGSAFAGSVVDRADGAELIAGGYASAHVEGEDRKLKGGETTSPPKPERPTPAGPKEKGTRGPKETRESGGPKSASAATPKSATAKSASAAGGSE